ncbi:MAG: heme exporter protein CcmB [Bacteroidales bacterium]|nr:heme exporter protein CcmB [Bacteroidales bacterium]
MRRKELIYLIKKDLLLEWRQMYAINAILLYVVSTVMIISIIFGNALSGTTWNALLWIIMMFSASSAISKSFIQEHPGKYLYYFSLVHPLSMLFSKVIYNSILLIIITSLLFAGFYFFLPAPGIEKPLYFIVNLLLGAVGMASVLTMVAAIAAKTSNNFTLMAVLSFPLMLPMLLINIKVSALSLVFTSSNAYIQLFLVQFVLINSAVLLLAAILYPYLWKD